MWAHKWPNLESGALYTYLTDSMGLFTKEKLRAYKSLEAYNYFYNGYVQTVLRWTKLLQDPGTVWNVKISALVYYISSAINISIWYCYYHNKVKNFLGQRLHNAEHTKEFDPRWLTQFHVVFCQQYGQGRLWKFVILIHPMAH